jgi:cytochrome c peroxidase
MLEPASRPEENMSEKWSDPGRNRFLPNIYKEVQAMKWKVFFVAMAAAGMLVQQGVAQDSLRQEALEYFTPIPADPPVLQENPLTPEKVELGAMLYFEPRLSKSALISCNTCHNLGLGGADYQETSTGHGWQKGPRNAPTVLNSVFNMAQFWDGRAGDLAEQAKGPVQASVEMNNTPEKVLEVLTSMPEYQERFKAAFPDDKKPVSFDNMARAIEAFEATLLTPDSAFDRFLKGEDAAMSSLAKEGLRAFMAKGCADCHGGVNMGGEDYFPFGVMEAPASSIMAGDKGRYEVTKTKDDEYVFKSPSLRNIELTPPYFHSGKVWSLREAVAVMSSSQLGATLTDVEIDGITEFLVSTTGVQPKVTHPILPAPTKETPQPDLQ